jgi:hypothetical protein
MPRDYVLETVFILDHETGEVSVDTTKPGMSSMLLKRGFKEVSKGFSKPYRRFRGVESQVRIRSVGTRVAAAQRSSNLEPKTARNRGV